MFTGIIKDLGTVQSIDRSDHFYRLEVCYGDLCRRLSVGDSVAVDGVCLTVTSVMKDRFYSDVMPETLRSTNFSRLTVGSKVNLEPSISLSQGIDGHLVLGHVDDIGSVVDVHSGSDDDVNLSIAFPSSLSRYICRKGSIAVNGVSLTISEARPDFFRVALVPHTLDRTNLAFLQPNDVVNLEIDMIARYLEKLIV